MNTLKKILLVLLAIIVICVITTNVYGFDLSTSTNNNSIKVGDEVTYTLQFNESILTADFILSYDSSKLEYIESKTQNVEFNNYEDENYIVYIKGDFR